MYTLCFQADKHFSFALEKKTIVGSLFSWNCVKVKWCNGDFLECSKTSNAAAATINRSSWISDMRIFFFWTCIITKEKRIITKRQKWNFPNNLIWINHYYNHQKKLLKPLLYICDSVDECVVGLTDIITRNWGKRERGGKWN